MPEVRKVGRRRPALRYRGEQNLRKSARLQEREDGSTRHIPANVSTGRIHSLPSPAASDAHSKELPQDLPSLSPAKILKEWEQTSCQDNKLREAERLRQRSQEAEDSTSLLREEPTRKRTRALQPEDGAVEDTEKGKAAKDTNHHPIKYWIETGNWPKNFLEMNPQPSERSSESSKKRKSIPSYTQSVKDGDSPKPYTREYEKYLCENDIDMDVEKGVALVSNDSKNLCTRLQSGNSNEPKYTSFPKEKFLFILERLRNRNESRICRDITPFVVPSAELLFLNGESKLEHVSEELNGDWTKCTTLAGPQPRPDFAIGLMSSAFTNEEFVKLKNYTASERATLFTENMYFPFLICEVKCGDQGIDIADRQNMHSSSIAINAIVQLYREADKTQSPPYLQKLNGQILVFSISHNHRNVRIHGHFALIGKDRVVFHRCLIDSFDMVSSDSQKRWTAYNFTQEIYSKFLPEHTKRICDALAKLDDPRSIEEPGSQDTEPIASSSQEPPLPPSVQKENDRLRDQVDMLLRLQQEQQQQQQEQQRQQQEQQRQQQENISKLQDMLVEQKEQNKEQIEQYKEQMEQNKEQMEQNKEIIKMLREQKSTKG